MTSLSEFALPEVSLDNQIQVTADVAGFDRRYPDVFTLGEMIYLKDYGNHPDLGWDYWGDKDDYEAAICFHDKFEPIEDEI